MSPAMQHSVQAYNTARASENKIHDDSVARRFGFAGGLVPGIDVYAYMMHVPVARWGRAWLERGLAACRFLSPVYEGEQATVMADETSDGLRLEVHSGNRLCATGSATLSGEAPEAGAFDMPARVPENRPAADESSLAVGRLLGMRPLQLTPEYLDRYIADVRETNELYQREGIAHPGLILRTCNWALSHNVALGPWIHVGSTVRNLGLARTGAWLSVRARVTANYERKGHRFVELAGLALAGERPVAEIMHVAIYRPRQVAEAAC
jgi:hypothetical protein